jgi:acyl-coenzyme A thioesterase 13
MAASAPAGFVQHAPATTGHVEDPFEDTVGPFFFNPQTGQCWTSVSPNSLNSSETAHGGFLLSFADYSLFVTARSEMRGDRFVTVSLHCDLVGSARAGDALVADGEVVKVSGDRELIFVSTEVRRGDRVLVQGHGILKKFNVGNGTAVGADARKTTARL